MKITIKGGKDIREYRYCPEVQDGKVCCELANHSNEHRTMLIRRQDGSLGHWVWLDGEHPHWVPIS